MNKQIEFNYDGVKAVPKAYLTGKGRLYKSDKLTSFEQQIRLLTRNQIAKFGLSNWIKVHSEDAIFVEIYYFYLSKKKGEFFTKKPDLDNLDKAFLDCFKGLLWKDDSQIVYKLSKKIFDLYNNGIRFEISYYSTD